MPARSRRSPMRTSCSRRYDGPGCGRRSGTARGYRRRAPGAASGGVAGGSSAAGAGGGGGRLGGRGHRRGGRVGRAATGDVPCATSPASAAWTSARPSAGSSPPSCDRWIPISSEHVGLEGDGLGLEVRALGLELEAKHLAAHRVVRRGERLGPRRDRRLDRHLAGDERHDPVARAGATSDRARRIASVSRVVTPLISARPGARRPAWRRTRDRSRGRRRAGAPSTTGSAVPGRSSGRPCAHSGPPARDANLPRSTYPTGYSHSMVAGGLLLMS